MSRFMDPTTDFGFKKLFGEEANKDLTISFLNDLLELDPPLVDLSFANLEQLPEAPAQRIGIYDLLCRDALGKEYLVEMQKSRIAYIQDRMVYYSTFPIARQAKKGGKHVYPEYEPSPEGWRIREVSSVAYGKTSAVPVTAEWNYDLKGVYCIAILGYILNGSTAAVNYNSIRNDRPPHAPFYEKLKFVTVELPLFDPRKPEYSLDRHLNRWLYFLIYAPVLDRVPEIFKGDKIIQKAFWIAELVNLTMEERELYELSLKRQRDAYAMLETAKMEGMAEGKAEGRAEGKAEGRVEGRIEGQIEALLLLFSQKLGPMPAEIEAAIRGLRDLEHIQRILSHFLQINDWEALRKLLFASQNKTS
ncbi:MAG: PD-(D/E)XK nuclease family transposase [candidate division KSB1 bacterium]|nr:PD-(D/E)XK nuclease family transposase [candidate division KSB1 bacterium]MDZ7303163.1 PD-(D/E)XK nuclease family transposase [candidate division KSB1 bacterium]MDZ7310142.1 PD-(D/E)XK nuclease family transposase [candidate division KSB1 bacterium]